MVVAATVAALVPFLRQGQRRASGNGAQRTKRVGEMPAHVAMAAAPPAWAARVTPLMERLLVWQQ